MSHLLKHLNMASVSTFNRFALLPLDAQDTHVKPAGPPPKVAPPVATKQQQQRVQVPYPVERDLDEWSTWTIRQEEYPALPSSVYASAPSAKRSRTDMPMSPMSYSAAARPFPPPPSIPAPTSIVRQMPPLVRMPVPATAPTLSQQMGLDKPLAQLVAKSTFWADMTGEDW